MRRRWWAEREKVSAVHDQDLEGLLETLGLLEAIQNGTVKCDVCGETVKLENILCVFPAGKSVGIGCDRPECARQVLLGGGRVKP